MSMACDYLLSMGDLPVAPHGREVTPMPQPPLPADSSFRRRVPHELFP